MVQKYVDYILCSLPCTFYMKWSLQKR